MPRYTRAWIPGGSFFFTVALLERQRRLLTDHIELLRDTFRQVRTRHPFAIDAMVVLPDHFHAIWTLPPGDAHFSTRMRLIKAGFSRAIPATERLSDTRLARGERGIRQHRFWEHAVRNEDDLQRHIDYIHYNPVRHGHVRRVQDWPHSSFHRYVEAETYPADWAGTAETSAGQRE